MRRYGGAGERINGTHSAMAMAFAERRLTAARPPPRAPSPERLRNHVDLNNITSIKVGRQIDSNAQVDAHFQPGVRVWIGHRAHAEPVQPPATRTGFAPRPQQCQDTASPATTR